MLNQYASPLRSLKHNKLLIIIPLTFSLDPRIVEAVSKIRTEARLPGLHNSFSSCPIITARVSMVKQRS